LLPANDPDVLIVGGGVVGLFCAYHLRLSGCEVVVVEGGPVGGPQSCSHGNSGFVGTQGAAPLNVPFELPGGLSSGVPDGGVPDSSVPDSSVPDGGVPDGDVPGGVPDGDVPGGVPDGGVSGGADAALRSWLAHYRNIGDVAAVSASLLELKRQSLDLLRTLNPSAFTATGMVLAFKTQQGFEKALRSQPSLCVVSPDEFELNVLGALYNPDAGHLRAPEFITELAATLEGMGVSIHERERVVGFEAANGMVTRVRTDLDEYHPHETVLAAGVWTADIARLLRIELALQPVKGYAVTVETSYAPGIPILLAEDRVAVAPLGGGSLRFAGGLELSGVDGSYRDVLDVVPSYLPGMAGTGAVEVWSGLRPCTPDSLPLLGRAVPYRNVTVACGHGTIGMGTAPATGDLIAQLLTGGGRTTMDLKPFRVDRFPRGV
jgi:D-amino-acid dehydrogenase